MRVEAHRGRRPLRAVHVGLYSDVERREPAALLEAWPTLLGVAAGLVRAGVETTIVQASAHRQQMERAGYPVAIRQLARAIPGVPIVVQDHFSAPPAGWRRVAWRVVAPRLAGVTFATREQADAFVASGALSRRTPVFEVFEGSSTFESGDVDEARHATGLHGDPCILWTGRLNARKDPLTALDAFERAAARLPGARLWCCYGDAPLLDAVRARIAGSAVLSERVTLLGTVPHARMEALFRAADLFVQTSLDEGCSYSIIEALSCGATPLVTDIPASRRTVGDAGALTPVGDARARFEQALSFDVIGRDLRAVYERVTGLA